MPISTNTLSQESTKKDDSISDNTNFLSPCNGDLHRYMASHSVVTDSIIKKIKAQPKVEGFEAHYGVEPWPLVLSHHRVADFKELVKELPKIVIQVLKNYFGQDVQGFCEYFDSTADVYDMLMASNIHAEEMVCRHDVLYSNHQLKLLEMNMGSNIGGWELDWLHADTLQAITSVSPLTDKEIVYRPVINALANALAKAVTSLNKADKTGNLLFRTTELPAEGMAVMAQYIQSHYEASEHYQGGQVYFFSEMEEVQFRKNGRVYFQGQDIDAVLLLDRDMPESLYKKLDMAYIAQNIVFPDSAVHSLIGSKTLMALLHEDKAKALLSEQQVAWVEQHVPWTVRVNQQTVRWQNTEQSLRSLLLENPAQFVLKKAHSLQGKDVFIGKFTEPSEWCELVERLSEQSGWIVQEFCPSDTIYCANEQSKIQAMIPVLAAFGFGESYGGAVARGVPVHLDQGVVNLGRGAEILVLLEDQTPVVEHTTAEDVALYLENNELHSKLFKEMMEVLSVDEVMQQYQLSTDVEGVPKFMRNYEYAISAWPFLISQQQVQEFGDFITPLVELMYQAIDVYFGNDNDKFSRYLDESAMVFELLKKAAVDPRELLIRHDVIFSEQAFKLLEINVGSTVGGWQHDWVNGVFDTSLRSSQTTANWDLAYRDVTEKTFASISDSIRRVKPQSQGHILLYSRGEQDMAEFASFKQSYRALYQRVSAFEHGTVHFFSDFNELQFTSDGQVKHGGTVMDAVLLTIGEDVEVPRTTMMRLVSSYLGGNIVFPDNPIHAVLGNKTMLALMHEPQLHRALDDKSVAFIQRYIPWTVKVNQQQIIWQAKQYELETLLLENKDLFVLKKARSLQGRDVFIGRYMSNEQWRECFNKVRDDNGWLVQQFCKPDPVVASSENSEVGIYEPVWGIFHLDNEYGGAFVRAKNIAQGNGIINSATGAIEFSVFEEIHNKKQKLVL